MPLIETTGAASARGFGLFAKGASDGTVGIFALGLAGCPCAPSSVRNKYTYASCSSTTSGVASATIASYAQSAAGNSTRGIFAIGFAGTSCRVATRNKYTYATDTNTTAASASITSYQGYAAGNSTRGIFALGRGDTCNLPTTTRNKFTYACCSSTTSGVAAASTITEQGSAAGNSTRGIFALGNVTCGVAATSAREKYTYASCTSTGSGVASATLSSRYQSAAGNSTRGIFAIGQVFPGCSASNVRNKYTYASDTNTATGVGTASSASRFGSAAGNSTRGIFSLGQVAFCNVSTRNKYTYACDASTASGVASASQVSKWGAASSWALCVNT